MLVAHPVQIPTEGRTFAHVARGVPEDSDRSQGEGTYQLASRAMDVLVDLTVAPPSVSLAEPRDLGSFKVLAQAAQPHPTELSRALDGVGTVAEDGNAFITVDAVRRLAGDLAADPDWNAGLDKMLAYAGSKGWMGFVGHGDPGPRGVGQAG